MSNGIDKNPLLDISKVYLTQVAEKKDDSYLEPDMKKRQKNNEKARKELAKGPQMKNPHFEEKRQEWDSGIVNSLAGAYKAMQKEGYGAPGHNPGSGEKSVARAKALMDKKGQKGAPGLDAMMAAKKEHEARRGVKKEEVEVDEAMSSYDRNRKRAAQRAADRNAARAAGKTGVVPGVGYVSPRKERETYVDSAGTTRHKSGAKMEEVEIDEADSLAAMQARREKRLAAQRKREGTTASGRDFGHDYSLSDKQQKARRDAEFKAGIGTKKEGYDVEAAEALWSGVAERLEKLGEMDGAKFKVIGEKLDPVGKEDGDVNNDGKKDRTDKYLMNRRKAIGSAIKNKMSSMKKEETEAAEYIENVAKVKEVERQNDIKRWIQKESRSSNWRNDLSEIMTDDIDSKPIKEKNVKNKIKINPKLGEAIEEIGGTVVEMVEVDEAMTVTNADKKGNTPAYQAYKAGKKDKSGKPMYKAADHMKEGDGDPCWDSHKQVGMKKKGGKMVPNCVPKNEEVEVEEYVDFLITEGYDCSDLTWDDMYEEYQSLDEGLRSAVKRLLGKKKEEPAKPMSRGDQLRKKYNVGPEKSDTSAKAQILKKTRAKADSDQKEFGGSRYSKGVADKSKAAHERQLKGGYSKYGADDARGRGNKARKRAAALTKEELEQIDELHKGKHGQSDKEYADSRSQGGKMVSGDSKMSGAEYTHGRRVKAANPGMQPDVGGKTKPKSQGKMDKGTRADLQYRKANMRKEEASMSPQEIQLQKKKAMVDRMIAQKRQQSLNKAKKNEPPAKAMGEATEDSLRDRRMERGGVDGNNRYDRAPKPANTAGKKKPYDGMSALEKVKASIRAKHGQGAIMDTKKK